ncbi:GMC family oxidoreductase [Streptomyces sp. NPDC048411]|uniref:GMC family oxidoreductase n=1 Tax=Streptomyces sp. NPDC048411 TaxID=3157206 RepID=UPI0034557C4E
MTEFDYLVVGGGTAGCVVAARLAENPAVSVGLIEWGPSDEHEPRARSIRRWAEMLEGEYDLDYRSVPQERGNSDIRQARLRILGGCSTANTMISWRPRVADLQEWVDVGADGWDAATLHPYFEQLQTPITPVPHQDQNPFVADVIRSASSALSLPVRSAWNDEDVIEGTGFFEIGYCPETNTRSSSSICYLHPAQRSCANLQVLLQTRALRLMLDGGNRAAGALIRTGEGATAEIFARKEVVVCAGAIDSPRLLQLSGVGPAAVLDAVGVDVRVDLPGVGGNLMDHAEGIVLWEVAEPPSRVCATGWDAGALLRLNPHGAHPDITMHFPVEAWVDHVVAHGVAMPPYYMAIAPNVAKPRSRGRVWITSADPDERPAIDYRYFTDPGGADEAVLVAAVRAARRIGDSEPMASQLRREVFPGPQATSDADISALARATHQTVYHVSGTCRMGAPDDALAVLDPELRVRGVRGLRVADASVFPTIPSVNPVVTVMITAEHAARLIRQDQ